MIDKNFWQGKRVFVTGHTGFKGSWLSLWLTEMGAIVKGYALDAPTVPSLFEIVRLNDLMESHIGNLFFAFTPFFAIKIETATIFSTFAIVIQN